MTLFDAHSLALPVVIEYSKEKCNGRRIDEEIKIDHFYYFPLTISFKDYYHKQPLTILLIN